MNSLKDYFCNKKLQEKVNLTASGFSILVITSLAFLSSMDGGLANSTLLVTGFAVAMVLISTWLMLKHLVSKLEQSRIQVHEARMSAQARMDFLSRMSHEIRTPVGAILGFGQLLQNAKLTKEEREYLKNIKLSGEYLIRILNDILDLSRIEANGIQLDMRPFKLICLVEDVTRMMEGEAASKNLKVLTDCAVIENLMVVGDEHRLKQVIMNLLSNAIKFTEKGWVLLTLRAALDMYEPARVKVRFEVSDSGIGMTPEQLEKIFKPYSQAHGGVSRKFGGTGLGLSISRQLVETMGGSLLAQSSEGVGSTFFFEIDFKTFSQTEALASVVNPMPIVNKSPNKLIRHPKLRILVAEDEALNRSLISKLFEILGFPVEFAVDGRDCVDRLGGSEHYDAIFLDLHMPHLNGIEIAARIKKGEFGRSAQMARLTLMSADVLADARGREIGVDGFISKPINLDELQECIQSIISQTTPKAPPPNALIVEDQPLNRQMIGQIIHSLGITPDFAQDGVACIEFLERNPEPDLIFLDLRMPRMDGWTVARKIRNGEMGERVSRIPIAIVSAEIQAEEMCRGIGVDAFITKPFDIRKIRDFVEKVGVELCR